MRAWARLSAALRDEPERLRRKDDIQVVLALDEIEFLTGDADTLDDGSRPESPRHWTLCEALFKSI